MSSILYYSNYCEHSKELLQYLTKQNFSSIKYLCIDKRYNKDGNTYVILESQQPIILPKLITSVPALLVMDDGNKIILGKDIYKYFKPKQISLVKDATNNDEPNAFSLSASFGNSISSDKFSFFDMNDDELSAKGNGGFRQMHSYAGINQEDKIETPDEDYKPDKIGEVDIGKLQESRNNEVPKQQMRI